MEVVSDGSVNKNPLGGGERGVDLWTQRDDVPEDVHGVTGPVWVSMKGECYHLGYCHIAGNKSAFTLPAGQDLHLNVLPHTSAQVHSLWGRNYTLRSSS